MSVNCVIGLQWGDEGKGRIVDYLAQKADMVIRFQGGDNAGHTVVNEKGKFGLHILPSGIFNDDTMNIVGAGTVVNFDRMHSELEDIEKLTGEKIESVFIDERAHIIMPYHMALDGAEEGKRSESEKIDASVGIAQCERLAAMKAKRDNAAVEKALADLKAACEDENENLMPHILNAVRTYATLGEICGVMRKVFGEYEAHVNL